jgi:hypothetical protein
MTKRFRVRLLPKAKAELEIIERWWALHRKRQVPPRMLSRDHNAAFRFRRRKA